MQTTAGSVITPLVLTHNEETNLGRTLAALHWARRVVVLDSGSTDATAAIARAFDNVSWHFRSFDSFQGQCVYGIHQTGIETEYVLALDADMVVGPALLEEIEQVFLPGQYEGGLLNFEYCMLGTPLAGSLYPAQLRLFKRARIEVQQIGHGHKFVLPSQPYRFKARLIHDDRKTLERWVAAQLSYSAKEQQRIAQGEALRWRDRLRQWGLMPWLIGALAYVKAGGPWRGAAAACYANERAAYECLLALRLLYDRLARSAALAEWERPAPGQTGPEDLPR